MKKELLPLSPEEQNRRKPLKPEDLVSEEPCIHPIQGKGKPVYPGKGKPMATHYERILKALQDAFSTDPNERGKHYLLPEDQRGLPMAAYCMEREWKDPDSTLSTVWPIRCGNCGISPRVNHRYENEIFLDPCPVILQEMQQITRFLAVPSGKIVVCNDMREWFPEIQYQNPYLYKGLPLSTSISYPSGQWLRTLESAMYGLIAAQGHGSVSWYRNPARNKLRCGGSSKAWEEVAHTGLTVWSYHACDGADFDARCSRLNLPDVPADLEEIEVTPGLYQIEIKLSQGEKQWGNHTLSTWKRIAPARDRQYD